LEVVHERCCGLDVHKKNVVACVITPAGRQVRSFGTMTPDLLQMLGWLQAQAVTHVAMESTGVYWKPLVRHEAPRIRVGRKESHLRSVAAGR
jgi:transposase